MNVNRKSEYLPKKLIKRFKEEVFNNPSYEYRTKNNFLKCLGIIYDKQINEYHSLYAYVATGSAYWKTVYSNDYHEKVIAPLLSKEILQSKDFGYRSIYVGIRYRINPQLTDDDCEFIEYIDKGKVISAEEILYNDGKEFIVGKIPDKGFRVHIDLEKADAWIEANSEAICKGYLHKEYIQHLPDKIIINYSMWINGGSMNSVYGSVESAKLIANSRDQELFYFKDSFYIANVKEFLEDRILTMIHHYKREISKVGVFPVTYLQNSKTLRLHNYLVNFPSKILKFIFINNDTVVQLDLRTSQFLLFANLLNIYIKQGTDGLLSLFKHKNTIGYLKRLIKVLETHKNQLPTIGVDIDDSKSGRYDSSDVTRFIRDVFFNDFYSVVQKELNLPERAIAKQVLFKLLFKRSNRRDALLDKLILQYPVVMSIIFEFKKKGNQQSDENSADIDDQESNFSVFLQCVEAEIFIDGILKPLREEGVPCFTRHDSIVAASQEVEKVENHAKKVFAKLGFKYNQKVEDKFWEVVDIEDLEDSGYLEWLGDENELTSSEIELNSRNESNKYGHKTMISMNHSYNSDGINIEYNEEEIAILERLSKIGFQDDYSNAVDIEFLEEISTLPFLSKEERNILYNDIANLSSGMNFLQKDTNIVIQRVFRRGR